MASNYEKGEGTFKWSDDDVKILCGICINFIRKNGRGMAFNWRSITIELNQKINGNCTSKVVKNKFDAMRKDWYIWKSLLQRETGLGRDPVSGKIKASDEWWTRKIMENKDTKRFRNKDFSFSVEELYHEILEGKRATDENVVAPRMDPSSVNVVNVEEGESNEDGVHNASGVDDVYSQYVAYSSRADELTTQEDSFLRDFVRDAINPKLPSQTTNALQNSKSKTTTTKSTQVKRKRSQSAGSAMLAGHIAGLTDTCSHALELMKSDCNSPTKNVGSNVDFANSQDVLGGTTVAIAMDIVNRMIAECHLEKASESWCFLMHLLEDGIRREIFINTNDDISRVAWLEYMHARDK